MLLYFFEKILGGETVRAMERIVSQMAYDMRRKQHLTQARRKRIRGVSSNTRSGNVRSSSVIGSAFRGSDRQMPIMAIEGIGSIKKLLGIALIAIGVILLLTKCFGGPKKEIPKELTKSSITYEQDTSYEAFIQDFNIGEDHLKELLETSLKYKQDYAHALAVWAVGAYKGSSIDAIKRDLRKYHAGNVFDEFGMYEAAENVYKQFIYDLKSFPIQSPKVYVYENGWKQSRTYNGNRLHYGIDIMSKENIPGQIEVLSMTDGIIENIGWNQTGGYRVGVRSPGGAYFYYAHLDSYAESLKKGDTVYAGEKIGMMGDTGYGQEGTRGQFLVHLHVGIAVKTADEVEFWINPYYLLKYLEKK